MSSLREGFSWRRVIICGGLASMTLGIIVALVRNSVPAEAANAIYPLLLPVIFCALLAMILWPIIVEIAQKHNKPILWIAAITGVWVAVAITCAFIFFVNLPIKEPTRINLLRFFNLPTILAAGWVAGLGWFIHHFFSARTQRVNNSFHILMQMQTSAELRRAQRNVARSFPLGVCSFLDKEYREARSPWICANEFKEALIDGSNQRIAAAKQRLKESNAVRDLFYLLNYFEFMAVGIRKSELDEDMLYETLRPVIAGCFKRADVAISQIRSSDNGFKLFKDALALLEKWERRYERELLAHKRSQPRKPDSLDSATTPPPPPPAPSPG